VCDGPASPLLQSGDSNVAEGAPPVPRPAARPGRRN
jgi:hypothetical protein